jgi:LEA14-like dessication related protein
MHSRFTLLFLGVIGTLISGCFSEKAIEFRSVEHLRPENIGKETLLSMDVVIYNPNNWGCTVEETDAEFFIDGKRAGNTVLRTPTRLPANAEATIPCTVKTSITDLIKLVPAGLGALLTGKELESTTRGTVKVRKFIFTKRISFEVKQPIDRKLLNGLR